MKPSDAETLRLAQAAVQAFALGDIAAARTHADAALARNPEEPNAHQILGLIALRAGDARTARVHLERANAAAPDQPAILNALGGALRHTGDPIAARQAFARAGEQGLAEAWRNLGNLETAETRIDAAIAAYERATRADPASAPAHAALARLLEQRHDLARAKTHAERALALAPGDEIARLTLAQLALRARNCDAAETYAAPILQRSHSPTNQALAWGLVGEARDKSGRPREAFDAFRRANAALDTLHGALRDDTRSPFHPDAIARLAAFAEHAAAPPPPRPSDDPAPAFLIGFPRSGTTLLDQILSAHSRIVSMEEKEVFAAITADRAQSDAALAAFAVAPPAEMARLRAAYWAGVRANGIAPEGRVFVDKLPLNLILAPLIARVFPGAKLIFAVRDPRDVILSCFQQRFGLNTAMAHFLDLERAARYYAAAMSLFDLCRARLPLDIHLVRYEDVVADLDLQAHTLADCLGVAFEPAMLAFHQAAARRDINTPSARQVIEPLYAHSVGRWRAYAEDLAPSLPILDPWVRRFGYTP